MFRRKKDTTETQKAKESKEAKDAREKKKLALFLTPKPPTPPLKKRAGRQPLRQGNAVLSRAAQQEYGQDSDSSSESSSGSSDTSSSGSSSDVSEAPAPSQSPESSPEARGPSMPQHLKSSLRPHESQEIVYVLSNPGQQESASKRIVKNSNVEKSKTKKKRQPCQVHGTHRKEKADRPSTDSDEECNLATPFIWTMGMVQKLVQFCSDTPPPR
ncbi:uncharacterized protein LOC142813963 isoform X1 [Rhipicephalus microplus]|uniref:uncharacterized protein LOC142813963 isoform X1 n=2 Tax=Rhipicephalus microplus TaxID=6941 RepID=UPI003F6C515D